jgi:hypothetical protein
LPQREQVLFVTAHDKISFRRQEVIPIYERA